MTVTFSAALFGEGGVGGGEANLQSTFRHMGIARALDVNMSPVSGLSVISESGVDWTVEVLDEPQAVPAFGLFARIALGLLLLAGGWLGISSRGRFQRRT